MPFGFYVEHIHTRRGLFMNVLTFSAEAESETDKSKASLPKGLVIGTWGSPGIRGQCAGAVLGSGVQGREPV